MAQACELPFYYTHKPWLTVFSAQSVGFPTGVWQPGDDPGFPEATRGVGADVAATLHPVPGAAPQWEEREQEGRSLDEELGKEGQMSLGHFLRSFPLSPQQGFLVVRLQREALLPSS